MRVKESGLIIFGIILVVLLILYGFYFNFTGNVIWGIEDADDCSNTEIGSLWESVFVEELGDSYSIIRDEYCENFIIYKSNSNNKSWFMILNRSEGIYGDILRQVWFYYIDGSSEMVNDINNNGFSSYSDLVFDYFLGLVDNYENIMNRNLEYSGLNSEYNLRFNNGAPTSWDSGGNYFYYLMENIPSEYIRESWNFVLYGEESVDWVIYSFRDLEDFHEFGFELVNNIGDFKFNKNSGWNFAFNISDYFNWDDNLDYYFNINGVDVDNLDGDIINFSINESGFYFMPALNFTGVKYFKVIGGLNNETIKTPYIFSNEFNVTITKKNNAPIISDKLKYFFMPNKGDLKVLLHNYFNDSDGDELKYRVSGGDDLNIVFNKSFMIINFKESFNNYDLIWIYVSDGINEVKSDEIIIYKEENIETNVLINGSFIIGDSNISKNYSINNNKDDKNNNTIKKKESNLMIWIIFCLFIFCVIVFCVWFFIFRVDKNLPNSFISPIIENNIVNKSVISNINNSLNNKTDAISEYLKNINLKKD